MTDWRTVLAMGAVIVGVAVLIVIVVGLLTGHYPTAQISN